MRIQKGPQADERPRLHFSSDMQGAGDEYSLAVLRSTSRHYNTGAPTAWMRVELLPQQTLRFVAASPLVDSTMTLFGLQWLVNKTLRSLDTHETTLFLRRFSAIHIEFDRIPVLAIHPRVRPVDIHPTAWQANADGRFVVAPASDTDPNLVIAHDGHLDEYLPALAADYLVLDMQKLEEAEDAEAQDAAARSSWWAPASVRRLPLGPRLFLSLCLCVSLTTAFFLGLAVAFAAMART